MVWTTHSCSSSTLRDIPLEGLEHGLAHECFWDLPIIIGQTCGVSKSMQNIWQKLQKQNKQPHFQNDGTPQTNPPNRSDVHLPFYQPSSPGHPAFIVWSWGQVIDPSIVPTSRAAVTEIWSPKVEGFHCCSMRLVSIESIWDGTWTWVLWSFASLQIWISEIWNRWIPGGSCKHWILHPKLCCV